MADVFTYLFPADLTASQRAVLAGELDVVFADEPPGRATVGWIAPGWRAMVDAADEPGWWRIVALPAHDIARFTTADDLLLAVLAAVEKMADVDPSGCAFVATSS